MFFIGFAPALALASRLRLSAVGTLAFTSTLSPVLVGGVTLILLLVEVQIALAPWISVAAFLILYLAAAPGTLSVREGERRLLVAVGVTVLVTSLLVFLLPLTDMWWRVRSDSWFHAAVLNRLGSRGLPLEDPYFSGLRLQYMYFYHVILLCVSRFTGLGPFFSMIFLNFLALTGLSLAFVWLTGFFARRALPRICALILCLFGMNGFFYLFFAGRLARALLGETRGASQFQHFFSLTPAGHDTAQRFLTIGNNQFLFLDKFMLGTALSLTLGLICICLGCAMTAKSRVRDRRSHTEPPSTRWREDALNEPPARVWSAWHGAAFVIAVAAVLLLHLIMGFALIVPFIGAFVIESATRTRRRITVSREDIVLFLLVALALAIAFPYVRSVMPTGERSSSYGFALQPLHLVGIVSGILPGILILIPVFGTRRESDFPRRPEDRFLAAWSATLLVLALVVNLPTTNESKFVYPLFIPLAAASAAGFAALLDRRRPVFALLYLLLATLPLNAVYFSNAFRDTTAFTLADDEKSFYELISAGSAADAVFLEDRDLVRIPVLAGKDQYWGTEAYAHNWSYPDAEMARRRALRDRVYEGEGWRNEDALEVETLERPFYIVCRLDDKRGRQAALALQSKHGYVPAYETSTIQAFLVVR